MIKIKNLSPIVAKCQVKEINKVKEEPFSLKKKDTERSIGSLIIEWDRVICVWFDSLHFSLFDSIDSHLWFFFIKDQSKSLLSLPNGSDLTLKPIEVYEMPVRLMANEEGALLSHLEVIIEDGKTM